MTPDKIPKTPTVRKLRLFLEARGQQQGHSKGLFQGLAQGFFWGRAEGQQEALLTLLRVRGIPVSPEDEVRIWVCTDTAKLDRWIARAAKASSMREVLGVKPSAPAARRRPARRARTASGSKG